MIIHIYELTTFLPPSYHLLTNKRTKRMKRMKRMKIARGGGRVSGEFTTFLPPSYHLGRGRLSGRLERPWPVPGVESTCREVCRRLPTASIRSCGLQVGRCAAARLYHLLTTFLPPSYHLGRGRSPCRLSARRSPGHMPEVCRRLPTASNRSSGLQVDRCAAARLYHLLTTFLPPWPWSLLQLADRRLCPGSTHRCHDYHLTPPARFRGPRRAAPSRRGSSCSGGALPCSCLLFGKRAIQSSQHSKALCSDRTGTLDTAVMVCECFFELLAVGAQRRYKRIVYIKRMALYCI